jgi:hypothetical protein
VGNPYRRETRNGIDYVVTPNGVPVPVQAWADMMGDAPVDTRAFTPAAEQAAAEGNLGVTAMVPPIAAAGPPTGFSVPMPFGSQVGHVTQPTPEVPAMIVNHTNSSTSSRSSHSTEQPYRRDDVLPAPAVGNPTREADLQRSQGRERGFAQDQLAALSTQGAVVDSKADANARHADELAAQREQEIADRSEFEQHVQEATAMREDRIGQRIAAIPAEDPAKMWQGTEGGLARAAGIMASAIGGLLAVSTGSGKNLGLEALQATIDRDIASQRANIENEWRKVAKDENELGRFRQMMGDERAWTAEQAAYRYASLATKLEAEASKYDSISKQAELQGMAASLMGQVQAKMTEAIQHGQAYDMKLAEQSMDRWYKTESLSLEERRVSSAEMLAGAKANGATATGPQRIGHLPHTKEDIYIPADIADKMSPDERNKLRDSAGAMSSFAKNAQGFLTQAIDVGRRYSGAGKDSRPVTSADIEQLRAAFASLQFDEVVKRTGLTATDPAMNRILTILSGTGEIPSGTWTIGSGQMNAFADFVVRGLEKDSNNFASRGAVLVNEQGQQRSFSDLASEARQYVDAAGGKSKPLESMDPFDLANSSMVRVTQAKTPEEVIDGFNTISTVNARNSQGDTENLPLAGSVNVLSAGAKRSGQVTAGLTAEGKAYKLGTGGGSSDELVAKLKAAAARASLKFPGQAPAINLALDRAVEALSQPKPMFNPSETDGKLDFGEADAGPGGNPYGY